MPLLPLLLTGIMTPGLFYRAFQGDKGMESQGIIIASVTSSCHVILDKEWQTEASILVCVVMLPPVKVLLNLAGLW